MSTDSLFAAYLKEVEGFETLTQPGGFACYKVYGDHIYLRDIYVVPEMRKLGVGKDLMGEVIKLAKEANLSRLVGSVAPSHADSTYRLAILLKLDFKLLQAQNDIIYLVKEI